MITSLAKFDSHRSELARAFRDRRAALSKALFDAVRDQNTATWTQPQEYAEVAEWGRSHLETAIDLLTKWFETQDPLFHELFEGWARSRMVADLSGEGLPVDYKPDQAIAQARTRWLVQLTAGCAEGALATLHRDLDPVIIALARKPLKRLNVLFIGDCIQFEIVTALLGPCSRDQISIAPTILNEKVQPLLRNRIRALPPDRFDLVFFSPFSHVYLPEYAAWLKVGNSFRTARTIQERLRPVLDDVRSTLDVLAEHFPCNVYVHNSAGTIQSVGALWGFVKNVATWLSRRRARNTINRAIAEYLGDRRIVGDARVQLIDESSLTETVSPFRLGLEYLNSHAFHPTRLGVEVGRTLYHEAVYTNAFLSTRKVVVCDLDNTLWDGVIGEGAVTHYLDRQALLKELRKRGVLLAIISKNDAKNVSWAGANLDASDFVAQQINWEPKVLNMGRVRNELNLKLKDFIFIDDRPDERERMAGAFPEVLTLDATSPRTWQMLAHWQKLLPPTPDEDRTRIYHERFEREQFLKERTDRAAVEEDESAALKGLGLSVTIREASRSDLKRAVELINRTNQFNLCGNRVSLREIQDGMGSTRSVILAEARDKFGSMGVVGVMLADRTEGSVEIPVFVLSCRVFGFGMEYALVNSLRVVASDEDTIVGHYKETQWNEPCRKLYPTCGMRWDGRAWVGRIAELPPDPTWLSVDNRIAVGSIVQARS
jgi:FkbH-like protein